MSIVQGYCVVLSVKTNSFVCVDFTPKNFSDSTLTQMKSLNSMHLENIAHVGC